MNLTFFTSFLSFLSKFSSHISRALLMFLVYFTSLHDYEHSSFYIKNHLLQNWILLYYSRTFIPFFLPPVLPFSTKVCSTPIDSISMSERSNCSLSLIDLKSPISPMLLHARRSCSWLKIFFQNFVVLSRILSKKHSLNITIS